MGSLISSTASLACFAGSCACSAFQCCCTAGNMASGGISSKCAKIYYVLMLGIAAIFALIFRAYGDDMEIDLKVWSVSCEDAGAHCKGNAAVFRISFVLSLFYFLNMLFTMCGGKGYHRGYWGPKLVIFFIMLIASIFISNNVFNNDGYAQLARIVSALFLLFQIIILLDFGHRWNESWVDKAFKDSVDDTPSDKKYLIGVLLSAAFLGISSLVGIGLLYSNYECHKPIITTVLIGIIITTVISLFRDRLVGVEGAILPSATVAAYSVYLLFSGLQSDPNSKCKPSGLTSSHAGLQTTLSIILAAVSLMWTSLSASSGAEVLVVGKDGNEVEDDDESDGFYRVDHNGETVSSNQYDRKKSRDDLESGSDAGDSNPNERIWLFHFIMITCSMYLAMILTNWGVEEGLKDTENVGNASMRVKFASAIMSILGYLWILIAPRVLKDREF